MSTHSSETLSSVNQASAGKIRVLSEMMINQIAAGEVITRPACVVRELVQNSIDAGATSIVIEVWEEEEELKKIRIRDNGEGISRVDLERAFLKHATSKINTLADMENIQTLGFRGEALSAIASISHVCAKSTCDDSGAGFEIVILGSEKKSMTASGAQKGFDITVSRLFFNTPVRKKFLKSMNVEKAALKEEISRQILATEKIDFEYTHYQGGKATTIFRVPAIYTLQDKIYTLFKRRDLKGKLISVSREHLGFRFEGYITNQKCRMGTRRSQYLFLRKRAIESPIFFKTLDRVYAHILPSKQYPMAFLHVMCTGGLVDVNIHPTKKQVNFENPADFGKALYFVTYQTALEKILTEQRQALMADHQAYSQQGSSQRHKSFTTRDGVYPESREEEEEFAAEGGAVVAGDATTSDRKDAVFHSAGDVNKGAEESTQAPVLSREFFLDQHQDQHGGDVRALKVPMTSLRVLTQLEKCYIVFTLSGVLYITDQHAAHERLNYDKILHQIEKKNFTSLTLVVPLFFERRALEVEKLIERRDALLSLGVGIEAFSRTVISVTEVPNFIPERKLERMLSDLLDIILEETALERKDFFREMAAGMACRMSVMAGDTLSLLEMEELLQALYEKDFLFTCPHGRPFVKKITSDELAKFFDRSCHVL